MVSTEFKDLEEKRRKCPGYVRTLLSNMSAFPVRLAEDVAAGFMGVYSYLVTLFSSFAVACCRGIGDVMHNVMESFQGIITVFEVELSVAPSNIVSNSTGDQ